MTAMASASKFLREAPWQLWTAQVTAIVRVEARKMLTRKIWVYLIALAPVVMIGGHALQSPLGRNCSIEEDTRILASIFQLFYLRLGIFFGCMGLFTWLFRGEIVEKSLHYYFLAPMRREVLIAGKFLAGLISSTVIFGGSVFLCFLLMYGHFGAAGRAYVFDGPGLGQMFAYLGVTVLACLGYGSLFLALSLFIKNPILPGVGVLIWETFHAVAPAAMQRLSVMFYLKQLCPVTLPPTGAMALFTVVAEPVSAWVTVPGLLILSAVVLVIAGFRLRRAEIIYLAD